MRVSVVSLSAFVAVIGSAVAAASCSSKSTGASGDSGASSGSSSGGSSSGGEDGGEGGAAPCAQFEDDASLTTPVVSFKNDVLPVFEHSCGLSMSCHAAKSDIMQRGIYLGCDINLNPTTTTCTETNPGPDVYNGLITSPMTPLEESCMPFVKPGDPTMSYLMHKMDGDQGCTVSCCTMNNMAVQAAEGAAGPVPANGWCGTFMPYQVALLPTGPVCGTGSANCSQPAQAARDTVRAWIKQGAMNN